jgi:gliding motility-associated-like protein
MKILSLIICILIYHSFYAQCTVVAPVPNDDCYQQVINDDSFCCNSSWDGICQSAYDDCLGTTPCDIDAPVPSDFCYQQVIAQLTTCCDIAWDETCQTSYNNCMGIPNCTVVAPVPTDFCYQQVISNIPSCCDIEWDETCQLAYNDCNFGSGCDTWANVPQDACYYQTINTLPDCCNIFWDANCNAAYYDCMGIESGCNADVSICTPGVSQPFTFNQNTPGPPTDYADPVGCATGTGGNDYGFGFIILYITQSGPLNLLINGSASSGFIDVVVYDIPSGIAPCDAVMNSANEIGCNYAPASVGCTQFGNDFPCTSSVTAPMVTAGQRIMVIVHDFSSQSSTFTLELGQTGAQTGPPDASITTTVNSPLCNNDPPIQLNTISLGGTWIGSGINQNGIFNPSVAGPGTHTLTYSIGISPCNDNDEITIEVLDCTSEPCSVEITADSPICYGDSITLFASFVTNGNYIWSGPKLISNEQNPPTFYPEMPSGSYEYQVIVQQNNLSCSDKIIIDIKPLPKLYFDFKIEEINYDHIKVEFSNNTTNASLYIWDFGDSSTVSEEFEPIHDYFTSSNSKFDILLKAISDFGCIDSTYRRITHLKTNAYFVPNSFTPNGDELNNQFKPIFTEPQNILNYKLLVYNKWGEIIFESNDQKYGWDGTYKNLMSQTGTYTWFIEFSELKKPSELKKFNGFINLIR